MSSTAIADYLESHLVDCTDELLDELPPLDSYDESQDERPDPLAGIRAAIQADLEAGPDAIDAAMPPRWICRPILPVAGASLAGPGATGKTTVVLSEMIRIVCGGELYGHEVNTQGACVLVTAEDGANHSRYVLQRAIADGIDCRALPEGAARRAKREIRVVAWSRATYGPIVTVDQFGGLHRAPVYDLLLELLRPIEPVYVTLDPAVLFSAGERLGNDGDAYLAAMLHETALEIGACMQLVDHVAQSVARAGIIDQYAARGGTAKTDNARLARQLVRVTPAMAEEMMLPTAVTDEDLAAGRVLQLHITKSNYAPLPPPAWLRRRGYWVEHLRSPSANERAEAADREREDRTAADVAAVVEYVRQQLSVGTGIRMTARDLEGAKLMRPDGSRISRDAIRLAVRRALATGVLAYRDLPPEERRGRRTEYLEPLA